MMDDAGVVNSEVKMKGQDKEVVSEEEEEDDEVSDSDEDDEDTIARIQRAHFAQAAAARKRQRAPARPRQMSQKRKIEAVKTFHDFTKKLKKDTGISIRGLVGNNILDLSDYSSEDSKSDSDGLSEEEFVVNPNAVEELNEEDESYIDPETGDFVEKKKKTAEPLKPKPPESDVPDLQENEEPKTLSITDLINEEDLDLTKNVEIAEVDQGELCPEEKCAEDILEKQEENSQECDVNGKLKDMSEISVKSVKKEDGSEQEGEKKPETEEEKKAANKNAVNIRRNIREVMDENQLDASTLAAQRQELERLARVQEQQRIIREVQRQIAINRQNKVHQKTLQLLQGGSSILKKAVPGNKLNLPNTVLVKLSSGEVKKTTLKQGQVEVTRLPKPTTSGSQKPGKPEQKDKKEVVEIVSSSGDDSSSSSSDSDDCIMLSDSEVPPSPEAEEDPHNSGLHVNDADNVPDEQGRVLINFGHPENEEDIFLAPQIARIIKPHQIGGVRFLFDNIIESIERFSTSTGFGCILAHSMGLGKTLQIVCFTDIFLRHTTSKTVLCIMPINTLQNWVAEFNKWLPVDGAPSPLSAQGEVRTRNFPIYVLNDSHKTLQMRAKVVKDWTTTGGVLMIGYELYRLLSMKKDKKPRKKRKADLKLEKEEKEREEKKAEKLELGNEDTQSSDVTNQSKMSEDSKDVKDDDINKPDEFKDEKKDDKKEDSQTDEDKKLLDEMYEALVKPGPDLVICDEGHRIKNSHSNISYALKQMRTKRRVVLTGYPLQNNLIEYWCMVDFVRPNYLGTKTEFCNMFERPIQNGQCIDSTPQDIKLMRYRAHVLHSLLVGFVQRRSHAVLQSTLPQKEEYVLLVRMTPLQRKLYDRFMNEVVRSTSVPNPLKAFAICCKIWNHPDVLYKFLRKRSEASALIEEDLDLEEIGGGARRTKAPVRRAAKTRGSSKKPAATIQPNTTSAGPNTNFPQNNPPPFGPNSYRPDQSGQYPYNYPNQAQGQGYYPPNPAYNQNYGNNYYQQQQQYGNNYPNPQYPQNASDTNYNQNYWGNGSGYYGDQNYYNNPQYQNNQNTTGEFNSQQYPPNYNAATEQSYQNNAPPPYGNNSDGYPNQQRPYQGPYPNQPGYPGYNGTSAGTQFPNQAPGYPNQTSQTPPGYTNSSGQTGQAPQNYPTQPSQPPQPYPPQPAGTSQSYPTPPGQPTQSYPVQPGQPPQNYPAQTGQPPQPYPTQPGQPASNYPTQPGQPASNYPTQPGQPASNYPTQPGQPASNYPTQPGQPTPSYPTQPGQPTQNYPTQPGQSIQNYTTPPGQSSQPYPTQSSQPQGYSSQPVPPQQAYPNQPYAGQYPENANYPNAGQYNPAYGYPNQQPTAEATPNPVIPKKEPSDKPMSEHIPNPAAAPSYAYNQPNTSAYPDQAQNNANPNYAAPYPYPPHLDVKPNIDNLGSPVTSWPMPDTIKLENDRLADLKSEAKAEVKSESDGEVKIEDLDTKKIVKEDTKMDKVKIDKAIIDEPKQESVDTKEKKSKVDISKSNSDSEDDTPKKGKQKGKGKESKKDSKKAKGKSKAKGRKDRKASKDDSDSEESEKEEKLNKEEELALVKKAEEMTYDWAAELLKDYLPGIIENSSKMELFFYILNESIKMGDRLLLFSQSLFTLNLIEDFLERNYIPGTNCLWERNTNYYRLDGSTHALEREKLINEFNANPQVYLFLVSTRAGSLGINLVGANRVIVFDASWNPCHDTQAVCRVYRYGQKKPCFVYRFVMDCCLEKKIYDRQINKQGMADRVVDECNPDAVLSMKEITNLCFDNDEKETEIKDLSEHKDKYIDVIMQGIIGSHGKLLTKEPFQHESLLVDRKEKKLSSAEKRLAKRGYELEKKAANAPKPTTSYRTVRTADGSLVQRPVASVRPMQHGARWIPADVWRRQGMTAQEMTLPLDVVIPTNSAEKTNIVLKAGQRVMVLKSPKGIYMQLESGKIIAIKTSLKGLGQKGADGKDGKKLMPRPGPPNLPGSLKNNSAITITSKTAPRPTLQRILRPGLVQNRIIRPVLGGPRSDIRSRLGGMDVRSYTGNRKLMPQNRLMRPGLSGSLSITKIPNEVRKDKEGSDDEAHVIESDDDEPKDKDNTNKAKNSDDKVDKNSEGDSSKQNNTNNDNSSNDQDKSKNSKPEQNTEEANPGPIVLTTDETLPSESALETQHDEKSNLSSSDESKHSQGEMKADFDSKFESPELHKMKNLLKNYRHQRPIGRPSESSLSQLERTASTLNKESLPDFRRNLDDITQSYSPTTEERPTKSRKKKSPNKIEPMESQSEKPPQSMTHSVSNLLGPGSSSDVKSTAPVAPMGQAGSQRLAPPVYDRTSGGHMTVIGDGISPAMETKSQMPHSQIPHGHMPHNQHAMPMGPMASGPSAYPTANPMTDPGYGQYPPGYPYGGYPNPSYYGGYPPPYYGGYPATYPQPQPPTAPAAPTAPEGYLPPNPQW